MSAVFRRSEDTHPRYHQRNNSKTNKHALEPFNLAQGQGQPRVLLYLARAHYEARNMAEAQKVLRAALHLDPADHRLRFNIALCMQVCGARAYGFLGCSWWEML